LSLSEEASAPDPHHEAKGKQVEGGPAEANPHRAAHLVRMVQENAAAERDKLEDGAAPPG